MIKMCPLGTLGLHVVCTHNVFTMCPLGIWVLVPSASRMRGRRAISVCLPESIPVRLPSGPEFQVKCDLLLFPRHNRSVSCAWCNDTELRYASPRPTPDSPPIIITDLPIVRVNNGSPVSSPSPLLDETTNPITPQDNSELLHQPQTSRSRTDRSIEWLARGARKVFGATPKKLGRLRKGRRSKSDQT